MTDNERREAEMRSIMRSVVAEKPEKEDRLRGSAYEGYPEEVQEELAQDGIKASADMEDNTKALPVIGMDGRTADGSVPFAILEKQLEFLK